jgi:hypothetical protein
MGFFCGIVFTIIGILYGLIVWVLTPFDNGSNES